MTVARVSATALLICCVCSLSLIPAVHSFKSYANDFVSPDYILAKNFSYTTANAQQSVIAWAKELAAKGPWSVMNKTVTPPSGNKHDYMSWAPYSWPDCSKAGNKTQLTPEQIWTTCPYVTRDGQFNPDGRLINDVGAFGDMSDAVLYNSIAWALNGSSVYSSNVAKYIDTWFLNPATSMTPNLNYAQMQRGPTGQTGSHTGVLDLKCMAKLVSGLLILRIGKAPEWTADLDNQLTGWIKQYVNWLQTANLAIQERNSANNHGSFYFNQLAALQILLNDKPGAQATIKSYFNGIYLKQIAANGDQPLETARTRPYHYRAYNLAAMITNARLGSYVGYTAWNITTTAGTTIHAALDYAMTLPAGKETASELYPDVAAVGATYGDPQGKYAKFLAASAGSSYTSDASFLWNQPLSDSGFVKKPSAVSASGSSANANQTGLANLRNGAVSDKGLSMWRNWITFYGACTTVMAISLVEFLQ